MDFTLSKYAALLDTIIQHKIPVYSIEKWIKNPSKHGIIIRHDVDRIPRNALKMASLENRYNIHTTYYFRMRKHTFIPSIINKIAAFGHEIGYHYEDLSIAKGNYDHAINLFNDHIDRFRQVSCIKTIAMHGSPLSKHNNLDLWNKYDFKDYALEGEAFLSIDYSDIYYFTDTGRSWNIMKNNLRDLTSSKQNSALIQKTDDLIQFIRDHPYTKIALVAHPERWHNNYFYWCFYLLFDHTVNIIKKFISL